MSARDGTRVVITIEDRDNPHSPVTVVRGFVSSSVRVEATCDDKHPVWHGAVLRFGKSGGVRVTFKAESREVVGMDEIKRYRRPVRCFCCRCSTWLATATKPPRCPECCLKERGDILRNDSDTDSRRIA